MSQNQKILSNIKSFFASRSLLELISHSISSASVLYILYKILYSTKNINQGILGFLSSLPGGKSLIDSQIDSQVKNAIADMFPQPEGVQRFREIPQQSIPYDTILNMLQDRKVKYKDLNPKEGKAWAYVYDAGETHTDFVSKANQMFLHTNVLNPMAFSSLRDMENEVVRMTAAMLHGDEAVVGNMTSGGTESILMIVKTYRDYAHAKRGVTQPEMLLPITAHPAFAKASQYFGVKQVFIPVDSDTKKPNPKDFERHINSNTIACIVSAPHYPHGVVDPVVDVARIAKSHNIPLHVDACIGGFVLPWIERLGRKVDLWDFRVDGVASISCDAHKYGYCSKGASIVLYRDVETRRYQFSVFSKWPGGYYVSPSALGSRGGGPIASAWASIVALGEEGFMDRTKMILDTFDYITSELQSFSDIELIGNPIGFIISFKSRDASKLHIYSVADVMEERGWKIERQLYPDSIHCTLMPQHYAIREKFVSDLCECIDIVKSDPQKYQNNGTAAMYGALADLGSVGSERIEEKGFLDTFLTAYSDYTYRY